MSDLFFWSTKVPPFKKDASMFAYTHVGTNMNKRDHLLDAINQYNEARSLQILTVDLIVLVNHRQQDMAIKDPDLKIFLPGWVWIDKST